jgi:predicted lipoprotein with Yx(FWY)xxD motif
VPSIDIQDQRVINGIVKVTSVVSPEAGFLVIYDDHGEKLGDPIGSTSVQAGENQNLTVVVDPNHMSAKLYAILHKDAGEIGIPEIPNRDNPDEADVPLTVDGQEVRFTFQNVAFVEAEETKAVGTAVVGEGATPAGTEVAMTHGGTQQHAGGTPAPGETSIPFPSGMATVIPKEGVNPIVQISDQEIKDGVILVENVVSVGQGWVVIWTLPESGGSEAIGFAPVKDGENANVSVEVDASKATPQMLAILHLDAGQADVFEQGADFPVHVGIQMIQSTFNATGAGATTAQSTEPADIPLRVVADDQPLRGGNTLIIAEVVSEGPGWIGIHLSEPNGELSHTRAIGAGHLDAGLNTNVVVEITNPARATEKLWAMLHIDEGTLFEYEFPDPRLDLPVQVDGHDLVDPFMVTGGLLGQAVVINLFSSGGASYLVDGLGFSLYTPAIGECTAECLNDWLPLIVTGEVVTGEGLNKQKLGIIGLGDGTKQVTFGGLPLYYYLGDFKPGDTNGQGLDGLWFLAQP